MQSDKYDGQEVELMGWVKRSRGSNKIRFYCVEGFHRRPFSAWPSETLMGEESFEQVKGALIESSNQHHRNRSTLDERAEGGHELVVSGVAI